MGQAERHETVLCRGCHLPIRLSEESRGQDLRNGVS
jgi:hypothetical protein